MAVAYGLRSMACSTLSQGDCMRAQHLNEPPSCRKEEHAEVLPVARGLSSVAS